MTSVAPLQWIRWSERYVITPVTGCLPNLLSGGHTARPSGGVVIVIVARHDGYCDGSEVVGIWV